MFLQSSRAAARPEFTMGSSSRIVVEAVPNYREEERREINKGERKKEGRVERRKNWELERKKVEQRRVENEKTVVEK